jgi:hypothetical protein
MSRAALWAAILGITGGCASAKVWLYHDKFVVAAESPHWEFKGELSCERPLKGGNINDARRACDGELRDDAAYLGATTIWVHVEQVRGATYQSKGMAYRRILVGLWPADVPDDSRRSLCKLAVHTLVAMEPATDRPIFVGSPVDECGQHLEGALPELGLALKRDLRLAPANDPQQVDLRLVMSPGWEEPGAPLRAADKLTAIATYPCTAGTTRENGARVYFRASGIWGVKQPKQVAFKCEGGTWAAYPDTGRIGFFAN